MMMTVEMIMMMNSICFVFDDIIYFILNWYLPNFNLFLIIFHQYFCSILFLNEYLSINAFFFYFLKCHFF